MRSGAVPSICLAQVARLRGALAHSRALDGLIASVAAQTFGLDPAQTLRALFPGRPMPRGLSNLVV